MTLAFTNPVHANGGLIFAAQDYAAGPSAFDGVGVLSTVRLRCRFPGVAVDSNGFMANDIDPDGDPLSYRIVTSVSHGTLETYLGGGFTYTPTPGYIGIDSFVYQLFAGGTAGSTATVTLTVDGAFAGVAISGRLPLRAFPAALSFGVDLQGSESRVRLRSNAAVAAFGTNLIASLCLLHARSSPAILTASALANQIVNGDFAAPDISPWILGPNTIATLVNGRLRISATVPSQSPIYIYQRVPTVPGTQYTLDADVIPGLGFGAAGIAIADTLVPSGGYLSYGGHINATYDATAGEAYIALHYAITDTSEYVEFDNVALTGLTPVANADLLAVISRVRLLSSPAALGVGAEQYVVTCTFALDRVAAKKRRRAVLDENAVALLGIYFVDDLGAPAAAPAAVTYRIDCMTTGQAVRATTALLATASIEVTLTGVDNAIIDQANVRELRRVTVHATYASGEVVNAQYDYLVRNLSGVV